MAIGLFFAILAVLLVVAMPVGGVFGIMAMVSSLLNPQFSFSATDVARSMFAGMNSFTLLAVPMFMVSGMIMAEGGLSERLFNFFAYFIGNKTAGFPCAVVVTCMFYAAISGSSPATVSAVGAMTIPFLVNMGYDLVFAAANASPSRLFIAGIIPGILIGVSLMVYCFYYCRKNGEDKDKLLANYKAIREIGKVFMSGAKTYVNILFVIAAANAFARCLTLLRYPQTISKSVLAVSDNRIVILLIMNAIMLVCGMIIDNIPNIMILTPILVPIATAVGVDPVHFGIIMTCNLAMGMITPPMGINLFVASGMTKIPMLKLARACIPFLIAFLISLVLIIFVPAVSMFLPGILG